MHTILRRSLVLTLGFGLVLLAGSAEAQSIREIPSMNVPDAQASYDAYGPVIYYNPVALQQMGPHLAAFLVAHEYAHHALGHLRYLGSPPHIVKQLELEADCQAARTLAMQGNWMALQAIFQHFSSQGGSAADALHPTGIERATMVARCAAG